MSGWDRCHVTFVMLATFTLFLSGCAEGWNGNDRQSRDWLPEAYPHLRRVIILLRTCQPKRPSGYNYIWVDGSNDDERPHCSFGSDEQISEIRRELKDAGVLGVSYWPSGSATRAVNWVEFILFREGLVTSGSSTSVRYSMQSRPCVEAVEGSDTYRVIERPITAAPCRWFWIRGSG